MLFESAVSGDSEDGGFINTLADQEVEGTNEAQASIIQTEETMGFIGMGSS